MAAKCVAISESSDVRTCWKGTVLAKSPLPAGKNLFLSYMGSLELIGEWKVTVESWYHTPVKPQLHIATPHLSWKSNDAEESSLGIPYASEINLNVKTDGCRTLINQHPTRSWLKSLTEMWQQATSNWLWLGGAEMEHFDRLWGLLLSQLHPRSPFRCPAVSCRGPIEPMIERSGSRTMIPPRTVGRRRRFHPLKGCP